MTPDLEQRVAIVEKEFTRVVHKRLLAYASYRLSTLSFHGVRWSPDSPVPGGHQPEDFVQQAVKAYLDFDRTWPEGVSFERFLRGAISSLISNLVRSLENRSTKAMPEEPAAMAAIENRLSRNWEAAEAERLAKETSPDLANAVLDAFMGEPELAKVAEGLIDGKPARQIAAEMGLSALQVQNIKKRLVRKATEARNKLAQNEAS